ncbi:MAG: winged helix DNA-binding protein [Desulfobacteraceae bacterium]|jgi:DNA-binding MarR family transcriptional regulator
MNIFNGKKIPIEKSLSRNLKRAYNFMHIEVKNFFKKLEISIIQFDLMETILFSKEKMLSVQELTSKTLSVQPNTTKNITELENAGFVERLSGKDRRIVMIRVTPKGKKFVVEMQKYLQEFYLSQFQPLTVEERYLLNDLLLKISHLS